MKKTLARFVNASEQTLIASANITFSSNTISSDEIEYSIDGGIQLKIPGTYMIFANFDVAPVSTIAQIGMYEGATAVPGAIATETVTAADTANLNFNTIVTAKAGTAGTYATIYFKTIYASSITNANVVVERI